ncbi:hypothetical protein [Haloferax sp. DFSO52]|uniref:hypothetical protein n=1 Tax=Haloferax sp. DFSO52 TaxID=3388505 RepID=UPI003A89AC80
MPVLSILTHIGSRRRIAIFTVVMMVASMMLVVGPAAAHNPACIIPGQGNSDNLYDSPHYPYLDNDPDHPEDSVASQTAFDHNPNLRDPYREKSYHPDQANSIHNEIDEGNLNAPRNSGENCHANPT